VYNPYYFEVPNSNGIISFKDAHNPYLVNYKMMKPKYLVDLLNRVIEGDPIHIREL
jgi:hypothetical protein